jgi:hypothetical protein
VRGGAWLVFCGGIVGGMLVALVVWLLGLSAALGLSSRGASTPEAMTAGTAGTSASAATTPAATAASTASTPVLPVPGALKPEATAQVPATGTNPAGTQALGASTAASSGVTPGSLHAPTLGTLPGLGNATASLKPTPVPAPLSKPSAEKREPAEAPKQVAMPARQVTFEEPPMPKRAKAEVSAPAGRAGNERAASAQEAAEEDDSEDLGLDQEFARELDNPAKRAVPAKRTVYIPPDPKPMEAPASLSQSDIFSVVVSNKGDITECVSAQKLQSEEGSRRVVMRWTILPSGKVTDVDTETRAYQGTPLALCLEGKIREWTFPKHQEQGGPVRFPFVF